MLRDGFGVTAGCFVIEVSVTAALVVGTAGRQFDCVEANVFPGSFGFGSNGGGGDLIDFVPSLPLVVCVFICNLVNTGFGFTAGGRFCGR